MKLRVPLKPCRVRVPNCNRNIRVPRLKNVLLRSSQFQSSPDLWVLNSRVLCFGVPSSRVLRAFEFSTSKVPILEFSISKFPIVEFPNREFLFQSSRFRHIKIFDLIQYRLHIINI